MNGNLKREECHRVWHTEEVEYTKACYCLQLGPIQLNVSYSTWIELEFELGSDNR